MSALLIDGWELCGPWPLGAGFLALLARYQLAQVPVVVISQHPAPENLPPQLGHLSHKLSHRVLLAACQQHNAQNTRSWLVTAQLSGVRAAENAGLGGCVWLGPPPLPAARLPIASATDICDAPRVMVPAGGGCWHDHPSA